MNQGKYDRSIPLLCPTCGNSQLATEEEDSEKEYIHCPSCERTMTKEELLRENGENIEAIKDEVINEIKKDLSLRMKKMFK